jgi:hypothetical protein
VDSTVFDDAVATQDTVTQLVAAMRKVVRVVPGAREVIARVAKLDYAKPGKPDIDWDDAEAKQALVSDWSMTHWRCSGNCAGWTHPSVTTRLPTR